MKFSWLTIAWASFGLKLLDIDIVRSSHQRWGNDTSNSFGVRNSYSLESQVLNQSIEAVFLFVLSFICSWKVQTSGFKDRAWIVLPLCIWIVASIWELFWCMIFRMNCKCTMHTLLSWCSNWFEMDHTLVCDF